MPPVAAPLRKRQDVTQIADGENSIRCFQLVPDVTSG